MCFAHCVLKIDAKKLKQITFFYFVSQSSFFLIQIKKTKPKVRRAESFKSKNIHRQILEIPTTDPGCDIYMNPHGYIINSGNDDDDSDSDDFESSHRMMRGVGQKSEGVRKFMPISYEVVREMPPELIIRSAKKANEAFETNPIEKEKTENLSTEFPPISQNRRTKSWHNFNRSINRGAAATGDNCYEAKDSLQLKFSLKKKFWTGTSEYSNKPLSWGIPPTINVPYYDSSTLLE